MTTTSGFMRGQYFVQPMKSGLFKIFSHPKTRQSHEKWPQLPTTTTPIQTVFEFTSKQHANVKHKFSSIIQMIIAGHKSLRR